MVGQGFQGLNIALVKDVRLHAIHIDHGHGLIFDNHRHREFSGGFKPFNGMIVGVFMNVVAQSGLSGAGHPIPLTVDFIRAQSYKGTTTTGEVVISIGDVVDVRGRDVIVVEDIVDTGTTVVCLLDYLAKDNPASLKLCTLLHKPSRRKTEVKIDYLGLTVPNRFVVGYGTDLDEAGRNLSGIYSLDENAAKNYKQDV